ncbi:MAG TPA: hypothetical protein VGH43_12445 [Jatrophihabitans sp.]
MLGAGLGAFVAVGLWWWDRVGVVVADGATRVDADVEAPGCGAGVG